MKTQHNTTDNNKPQDRNPVEKLILFTSSGRINISVKEHKSKEALLRKGFHAKGIYSLHNGRLYPVSAEFLPLRGIERRYLDDNPTWCNLAYCFYGNDDKLVDVKIENIQFITKKKNNASTHSRLRQESAGNAKPAK